MAKRITRSGNIDQVDATILHTAVGDATLGGLSFNVPAGGTITVSKYDQATGVTSVLYAIALEPGSGLSDSESYSLLTGDYISVLSSTPGSTFNTFIELP